MREIQIDLTLRFRIPENRLNTNGVLLGLRNAIPKISFAILEALFLAIEEREIFRMQNDFPSRYVRNGPQAKARQIRTSFGPSHYPLAQLHDRTMRRTVTPLLTSGILPKYRRYPEDAPEAGIGQAVHIYRTNLPRKWLGLPWREQTL